ncbi:hypothetical protein Naga_101188g2 [Nannochloropsis gaditana]|uniref:Uncharacterized protein n=1 Tax=Nannochloropsis gaditana TaxID=72520 RepID=W7TYV9_9STRA|nr:hypothetical protein Naga_101188g2 [Nannochloropsis gaditana]
MGRLCGQTRGGHRDAGFPSQRCQGHARFSPGSGSSPTLCLHHQRGQERRRCWEDRHRSCQGGKRGAAPGGNVVVWGQGLERRRKKGAGVYMSGCIPTAKNQALFEEHPTKR